MASARSVMPRAEGYGLSIANSGTRLVTGASKPSGPSLPSSRSLKSIVLVKVFVIEAMSTPELLLSAAAPSALAEPA